MSYQKEDRLIKTYGLVLTEYNSGENNKVLTLLTPGFGKITVYARGARKPRSSLMAATQIFSFSEFILFKGVNMMYVNSAETVDVFYNIRTNYANLEIGFEILKTIKEVSPENYPAPEYLKLALTTLNALSRTDKDKTLIHTTFKTRLLFEMGYKFNLQKENKEHTNIEHTNTDETNNICFAVYKPGSETLEEYRYRDKQEKEKMLEEIPVIDINKKIFTVFEVGVCVIDINVFNAINYIYDVDIEKIFNFNIKEKAIKELTFIVDNMFEKYVSN